MLEAKDPSQEQIKEFWEWCGFREVYSQTTPSYWLWWLSPEGSRMQKLPPIDPNNLFKYAVPKLTNCIVCFDTAEQRVSLYTVHKGYTDNQRVYDKDPALALFWAIYKIIEK